MDGAGAWRRATGFWVTLLSGQPFESVSSAENRFRVGHQWMVYLHVGSAIIAIVMIFVVGGPINPARGGLTSIVHVSVTLYLIALQWLIRRHDRRLPGIPLPGWVMLAGVLGPHISVYQGLATWGMSETLGFIIVPTVAVYSRLSLDRRLGLLVTAIFLAICATIYALLHFDVIPWAWAYYDHAKPPPPRPGLFILELFIVFGLTAFIYFWIDRLSESVIFESGRARGFFETTRAFFDASPDGVVILDGNGQITEANAAAQRMLGEQVSMQSGSASLLSCVSHEYHPLVWDTAAHEPKPMPRFERVGFRQPGDSEAQFEARIVSFRDDLKNQPNFVMTLRDRRDEDKLRVQLQRAQRLDSLGALAGGVAHDLNNALNPILGFANLEIQTAGLSEETRQSLELIRDCAVRATGLSKQLLALSRGGAPEVRWINAVEIAVSIVSVIDRATPPGVVVSFNPPAEHIEVEFSAAQLEQVLLNLLTNGVEAIGEKGLLRLDMTFLDGDRVRDELIGWESESALLIEVTDSGCGIPEKHMKQIFDPFFTTKESRRGTGLGLSVVERIVNDARGVVRVESREGVGSVFRVYLPNARLVQPSERVHPGPEAIPLGRSLNIFAVDDEPSNLVLVQRIAERLGDRVTTANSSTEARAFAVNTHDRFDLVLMDLLLPDGNGADLYEEIREKLGNPRVIFLSGYSRESIPKKLIDSDRFEGFFPKPINVTQLSEAIRHCRSKS